MTVTKLVSSGGDSHLERQRIRLEVVAGPARGAPAVVDSDIISLGSSDQNVLTLADPSVSRHHARIDMRDGSARLTDLGSTNGTFVNDVQVVEAVLPQAATLKLGDSVVSFSVTSDSLRLELSQLTRYGGLLGRSVAMRRLFAILSRIEGTDSTVLIEGESGTGKELIAEAIHEASPRRDGPFVVVDCGAMPANLIESELFGHERGAFTGATASRAGAFELADGGTLFLDEIGELETSLQPRLLRALDRRRVKRVGAPSYIDVDVRIVAATNRDLQKQVAANELREDLFFRLAVVRLHSPPLRERPDDVELLARHFVTEWKHRYPNQPALDLTATALAALKTRAWRGNVRELRNHIERAAALASHEEALATELPGPGAAPSGAIAFDRPYARARAEWVDRFEREYVTVALERAENNVAKAAREIQLDRAHLFRLIKKHDLRRK